MPTPSENDNWLNNLDISQSPGQTSSRVASRGHVAQEEMDFSHGDVTAFAPPDWALPTFISSYEDGGHTAYTKYRGNPVVCERVAENIGNWVPPPIESPSQIIITPGTQAGLFLALSALVGQGGLAAVVKPDYFGNRRVLQYIGAEIVDIDLKYDDLDEPASLDLEAFEQALQKDHVQVLCLSNPNNPTGCIYPPDVTTQIAAICRNAGTFLVVDELYCRLIYDGRSFTHMRSLDGMADSVLTLLGPSKMESLSGFRLGVAIGPSWLIDKMEKLLSIVSLRAPGYAQMLLTKWLTEPPEWIEARIQAHQQLRDSSVRQLRELEGLTVRVPEGGSYLFPRLPPLAISTEDFVARLAEQERIFVTPGTEFGPTSTNSFRINFSQHAAQQEDALGRLVRFAKQFAT